MKKLLFSVVLASSVLSFMTFSGDKPWREQFNSIDHYSISQKLGYDPQLELIPDENQKIVQKTGPTLYIHGWLGSKDAINVRNRCNDSNKIPGDVIIFNFEDACRWARFSLFGKKISFPYWMPLNKSNFAQEKDIKSLLCVLDTLTQNNIQIPICYSHSRGGAVLKKAVGILNNPSQEWQQKLTSLNITKTARDNILKTLKIVYLNTPLKQVKVVIQKRCEKKLFLLTAIFPFLQSFVSNTVSCFVQNKALPAITSYNSFDTREPMDYLSDWKGCKIATLLHFQYGDKDVPNIDDLECATQLVKVNPDNTYVIMGNDGGHNDGDNTIAIIIHALNKSKDCSFIEGKENQPISLEEIKFTNSESVENYMKRVSAEFEKENKEKNKQWLIQISKLTCATGILSLVAYIYLLSRNF